MGCELCQMENRENNDIRFTRDGVRPIKEYSRNRQFAEENNLDKDSYYNLLEERLNEKYSIPEKTLDELRERINNENNQLNSKNDKKNEYIINTLNIYSNNTIKFGSGEKNKKDNNKADDNFSNFYNRNNRENENEKENKLENGSTYRKNKNRSMEKIRQSKDDLRYNIEKARERNNNRNKRYLEDKENENNNKNNSITDNDNGNDNDNKENKPENENKKNKHKHRHNHSQEQCQHHHHHHHHHKHKHKSKKDNEQNAENYDGGNNEKDESELQEEKRAERKEKSRDKRSKKKDRNDMGDERDERDKSEKKDRKEKTEKKDRKNKKKNIKENNESDDNDNDNENDNNNDDNKENISNNNILKKNSEQNSDKNISFNNKEEKDNLYSENNSKDESASEFEKILKNNKNNDDNKAKEKNEENNLENDNSEEGQGEGIRYTYTKQLSKNTEKINLLLQQIRHPKIDKIIKDAPKRSKTTLQKLKEYLKKNSTNLSLVEKAWLDFKWVAQNIEYDFAGVNDYNYDITPEATFNRGMSICSGYAGLYKDIGDYLGLTIERIGGFSKGFNFKLGENIEDSEKHEWNAVQIDGDWYFIESTWGAGFSSDQKNFTKKFTPYYFFTPPQEFVRGHLPFEPKWQLLPKTKKVSQQTFMEFAPLKSDFFTLGFNKIDPDYTFNDVKEKGKITLYFEKDKSSKKLAVMGKLYSLKDDQEIPNSILEIPKNDCFEVNYFINKKGEYKLKIFGNDGSVKEYNELCTLKLTTVKDSSKPLAFPATTSLYHNSDIEIIQPDNGILYEGDKITFEFKTTTFDQLFIGISTEKGASFTEMNKKKNVFKEEDILVYGKKILISCRGEKENSYNSIMEYNVLTNPKNKVKITFPQVFAGPKNRLIEPICDTLKKGKKVFFKVRSNLINEMSVHDGEQFNKLNKDDDVFSGEVKVTGKGEVKIVYKKDDNGSYGVLYSYKVS